jgi:peptidyl-prolyl cis-trans isomerase B (cyclophilin B)
VSTVTLNTTHGDIVIELANEGAPKTVANFEQYVKDGHFSGTIFHRVIKGFMIQGGGMEPGMGQKPVRAAIAHEGEAASKAGLKNSRGTIAMARTNDPHSATAQFFLNTVNNDFLDFRSASGQGWGYVAFGKITSGMDVMDKIEAQATRTSGFHQDVPVTDIIINSATLS